MDDAEDRTTLVHQADRDRAAPPADQVVARAVVRVHQPDRRAARGRHAACFLAQVAPVRESLGQPRPDQVLGFGVGLGLVDLAAWPAAAMEIRSQQIAGAARGFGGHVERAAEREHDAGL